MKTKSLLVAGALSLLALCKVPAAPGIVLDAKGENNPPVTDTNRKNSPDDAANLFPKYRVSIDVSAKDTLKDEIESYLRRELRTFSDVLIVTENPTFTLKIIGEELKHAGSATGVALSVVVSSWHDENLWRDYLKEKLNKTDFDLLLAALTKKGNTEDHILIGGPRSDVKKHCAQIIVQFDTRTLEESRKFRELLKKVTDAPR